MKNTQTSRHPALPSDFYRRNDVTIIARELLGKYLCTRINGDPVTSGMIVETEAYAVQGDKACHANGYRRTDRNDAMFREGGIAYVYLCYGIHHLFNVVTNRKGEADAVLIRAIKPAEGLQTMLGRRNHDQVTPKLTAGPGRLTEALGIDKKHYGSDLQSAPLWIEDHDINIDATRIEESPRIGVNYAGEDAQKPWRYTIAGSKWVSR